MAILPTLPHAIEVSDTVAELDAGAVAKQLVGILGRPLVALLTGVSATRVVRGWETGGGIAPERENALRVGLQAALIIKTRFKDGIVRNWFGGHNTLLDDRAPGELIRALTESSPLSDGARNIGRRLLSAARAFVTR